MRSPARKLKRSAVKNIVRFPPVKANDGKTILVESILESQYCLQLEFIEEVFTYFPQPKTFSVLCAGFQKTYTPDFEVHYVDGRKSYVEVKPAEKSEEEDYQTLFDSFRAALCGTGYNFEVVTDKDILIEPRLANYEILYRYRKRPLFDMRNLHKCAARINRDVPLGLLINTLEGSASLKEIYSWLALGYVQFAITSQSLDLNTRVHFNVC